MLQQIIVILIGIITFGLVSWKLYRLLTHKPAASGRCAGCEVDCALRDMYSGSCDNIDEGI